MEKVINLLLIEDDMVDVQDAQRTLDRMDIFYKMAVAKNGEEALSFLEKTSVPPDIILLDLNMPRMSGMEFLTELRKKSQWKNIKVFVTTTAEEKEDREKAGKLGISGYIVKPLKFNNPSSIDSFNLMIDLLNIKNKI